MVQVIHLSVDPKYRDLIPRPIPEQFDAIVKSIREHGQLEELICNPQGIIIDGHTRYDACKQLGKRPKFRVKTFDSKYEELLYMMDVNLKRRHLTPMQRYELVAVLEDDIKQQVKKEGMEFRKTHGSPFTNENERKKHHYTIGRIGKLANLSHSTVENLRAIKKHGTQKTINELRTGKITVVEGFVRTRKERLARKEPTILKSSYNARHGIQIKQLRNIYHTKIGLMINEFYKLLDGETQITHIAMALNKKYDHVVSITERLEKHKFVTIRRGDRKTFVKITPKGKEFHKKLIAIEKLCKLNGVIDWL